MVKKQTNSVRHAAHPPYLRLILKAWEGRIFEGGFCLSRGAHLMNQFSCKQHDLSIGIQSCSVVHNGDRRQDIPALPSEKDWRTLTYQPS